MKCRGLSIVVVMMLALPLAHAAQSPPDAEEKKGSLTFKIDSPLAVEGFIGETVEIGYSVTNTGTKPIKILSVTPRRGAGMGSAHPEVLAPGASGKLVLRREVTDIGARELAFRVHTDDKTHADDRITARVFGMSAYTPDVPNVLFESARFGVGASKQLTISSYETPVLDVKAVLESPSWLKVVALPRDKGDPATQDVALEVVLLPDAPKGVLSGQIHLLTTSSLQPDLIVPVTARIFGDVSATPYPAVFKPAHAGDSRLIELEFRALDGKPLTLQSLEDSRSLLSFETKDCGPGCAKASVRVKAPKPDRITGTIRARFHGRVEPMLVAWELIVVPAEVELHDLGVLGDSADVGTEGSTATPAKDKKND